MRCSLFAYFSLFRIGACGTASPKCLFLLNAEGSQLIQTPSQLRSNKHTNCADLSVGF
ncbi:hypothetical protein PSEUDO9AG_60191 [Pseudomonas sp. 9Ag]|nr:hypothetical protein PSEUDO9AG_60191 [Pseudomonas sp. 9Ag]